MHSSAPFVVKRSLARSCNGPEIGHARTITIGASHGGSKGRSFGNLGLIRVPEFNEGDAGGGKRGVFVEEHQHFCVVEEERGDERRKDQEPEKCPPKRGEEFIRIDHSLRAMPSSALFVVKRSRARSCNEPQTGQAQD